LHPYVRTLEARDSSVSQGNGNDIADVPTMTAMDAGKGAVIVRWDDSDGENAVIFAEEFCVGRGNDCRVRFYDPLVSRNHARVYHEGGTWRMEDLGSRNGTMIDEKRADRSVLPEQCEVWVNEAGPVLRLELVRPGPETRSAMSAFSPGRMVAQERSDALSLARQRQSDAEEK